MIAEHHYFALRVANGETLYGYGTDAAARSYCYRSQYAAQGLSPAEVRALGLPERYDVIDLSSHV